MEEEQKGEVIEVRIIREKKQLSVRFPAQIVERFNIDPDKDTFFWAIHEHEKGISLSGSLAKGVADGTEESRRKSDKE